MLSSAVRLCFIFFILRSYECIQNGVSVDCDSIPEDDEEDEDSGDVMSGSGGSVVR